MGEPVFLQFPILGGIDQKNAAIYVDPQQNQANVLNGNFSHVGQVDKRYGIVADVSLSAATILGAASILDSYLPPASNPTGLSGFGNVVFQGAWAWTVKGGYATYVGQMPSCSVVRRPLPVQGSTVPIIVDGVPSKLGTVRVAAWVQQAGSNQWNVQSCFLDPATSSGLYTIPTLQVIASGDGSNPQALELVALINLGGTLALFLVNNSNPNRTLIVYSCNPNSSNPVWVAQAGANLALEFSTTQHAIDVQPFVGDPSNGYIVLYLPNGTTTTLEWNYFQAFVSISSGALTAASNSPAFFPVYIQADWGSDVAFFYSDTLENKIFYAYYSGDGVFSPIVHGSVNVATLSPPVTTVPTLLGCCRMTTPYTGGGAAPTTQIYLAFGSTDSTYSGADGGPIVAWSMGVLVNRVAGPAVNFVFPQSYPASMLPVARPMQPVDGLQVGASFCHVVQPCAMTWFYAWGNTEAANNPRSFQNGLFMVDYRIGPGNAPAIQQAAIIATVAPRQLDPFMDHWSNGLFSYPHLPPCATVDGKSCLVPLVVANTGPSGVETAGIGLEVNAHWLAQFSLMAPTTPGVVTINQSNQIDGAIPQRLLGTSQAGAPSLLEHGFIHYPEFCFTLIGAAGVLNGTYGYAVVYGRQDANGNIERSAPDIIAVAATPATQKVVVYFPALAWWANRAENSQGYFVEIYRTVASGSTFYCVTRLYPGEFGASSSPFIFTYTDNTADSVISQAEILYTTGGFLDAVNPPAAALHCAHRGRYAVVDETLRQVWFSQTETQGEVLGFNEALIQPFVEEGDITAIGSMDDKFVVWKSTSVWVMYGDGPAGNGQGSDWTAPQKVPSDVGCVSAASIALIPDGYVFLSQKGFCLLSRGLQVLHDSQAFSGKRIQDIVAAYPTCISSVVVPYANQARFVMQAAGGAQIVLVLDYLLYQWTTHGYSYLDAAIAQVLLVGGQYAVITTKGTRYLETLPTVTAPWLDVDLAAATHFVPTVITFPWVKVSGVQGYQRARRVLMYGVQGDPCGVLVQLQTDYRAPIVQSAQWTSSQYDATKPLEIHVGGPFMKSMSVKVTLSDTDDTAKVTGQGMSFGAIDFDMDKIGDRYRRLPSTNRA